MVKNLPASAGDTGSIPGSWKLPHVSGQLSPFATSTEPACCNCWGLLAPEPVLCNKGCHHDEKPRNHKQRKPARSKGDPGLPNVKFEIFNIHDCCFKPLKFGIFHYIAMNDWYINKYVDVKHAWHWFWGTGWRDRGNCEGRLKKRWGNCSCRLEERQFTSCNAESFGKTYL